jgi:hypothetical protein
MYSAKVGEAMPYNDKKKETNKKWDKEHMKKLATGLPTPQADQFIEYCNSQGKSVHTVLKEYALQCIKAREPPD